MIPGAVRALTARDLEFPRDISLVGCDDIVLAELYRPPIAWLFRDNSEIGRIAELLIQLCSPAAALHAMSYSRPSSYLPEDP